MNRNYTDITNRIQSPPLWFDEHGVPRYDPFHPDLVADIYADEVALLLVDCQGCGRPFNVCISWSSTYTIVYDQPSLSTRIADSSIHYGDPPNIDCCPAGPTMNSVPRRVVEFWRRTNAMRWWERVVELEGEVRREWAED